MSNSGGSYIRYLGPDDETTGFNLNPKSSRILEQSANNLTDENFISESGILALIPQKQSKILGSEQLSSENFEDIIFNNSKMFFFCQL